MTSRFQRLRGHPGYRNLWYICCVTWVIATAWLLYYFTFANYGEFDPEQSWLQSQQTPSLESIGIDQSSSMTLVHVRTSYCSCNPLADAHTATVPDSVAQHWISADALATTGFHLPATPAALIYQHGELIYAGPYASGAFCAVEDSLIDDILRGEQQLAGTYLNGLVRACRCLT